MGIEIEKKPVVVDTGVTAEVHDEMELPREDHEPAKDVDFEGRDPIGTKGVFVRAATPVTELLGLGTNPDLEAARQLGHALGLGQAVTAAERVGRALSPEVREQVRALRQNLITLILNCTRRPDAEKLVAFDELRSYCRRAIPALLDQVDGHPTSEFRITAPPTWTVSDDAKRLAATVAELPERNPGPRLHELLGLLSQVEGTAGLVALPGLENAQSVLALLGQLGADTPDPKATLEALAGVDAWTAPFFEKVRGAGEVIATHPDFELRDPKAQRAIGAIVSAYFSHLDDETVRDILADVARLGPNPGPVDTLRMAFRNVGPLFHKAISQQLGTRMGQQMEELFRKAESRGKQVPFDLVQAHIDDDPGGYDIVSVGSEESKVRTGTIAQTHHAVIRDGGVEREVVIRFLKPGIAERVQRDLALLRAVAVDLRDNPDLAVLSGVSLDDIIAGLEDMVSGDLDLSGTIKKQKLAAGYYDRTLELEDGTPVRFHVPAIYDPPAGETELHVQELCAGVTSFSELAIGDKATAANVAEWFVYMYFQNALVGEGFFHFDPHEGNFGIVDNRASSGEIVVPIFDYGMVGTMTKKEQQGFLLAALGAKHEHAGVITRALMRVMSLEGDESASYDEIKAGVKETMARRERDGLPPHKPQGWIGWLVNQGYGLPQNLTGFSRGSMMLVSLLRTADAEDRFPEVMKRLTKNALSDKLFGGKYPLPLSWPTVFRAALMGLT